MRSGIFIYHNYIAKLQRSMVALASREALCGLLAAGCWLLAAGCWLLAAAHAGRKPQDVRLGYLLKVMARRRLAWHKHATAAAPMPPT
ncbi:hypothetical protein DEG02_000395 [Xanthomonas vasicola]|nr:hypothetical protein KWO_001595 [Xanthomonas vasicola pv. musacearum NCPPB 4379]KFA07736.1 hypothetical protein KWQ_0115545 [Xanthomonas vasicola pv. musacearum NCPPB 4380]RJL82912.1 hypothetical protein DEG03_012385 [Xanthomonas vasicola]RRJ42051.1 hypothetical protein EIM46_06645 [Xanthomonas vasicola pv. musacearum]RJN12727.1 hypothetical protein DEG00_003795 [Xanthomonas vasicola]